MPFEKDKSLALAALKTSFGGQALLSILEEEIKLSQLKVDLEIDPGNVSAMALEIGKLRALHLIKEILLMEYVEEEEEENDNT